MSIKVRINRLCGYPVFNSHLEQTNEFLITLEDGSKGQGASPQGETISIYEDRSFSIDARKIVESLQIDGMLGTGHDQQSFDAYLKKNTYRFGKNNVYALSLAFFNALCHSTSLEEQFENSKAPTTFPRICFNIINGGWHAYTNPVLSDFTEYLLVAKNDDLVETIGLFREVYQAVKERLVKQEKTVVAGNVVNTFRTRDNRECLDFLLDVCQQTGASDYFDLMIDASATDLWQNNGYRLEVTGQGFFTPEQFLSYWQNLIAEYNLGFLEDPFFEKDERTWQQLTASQESCAIIGDNFYTTDTEKILEGAEKGYTHGVLIKPNQAGTVTDVRQALAAAKNKSQIAITSHRSISTESTFLSALTCLGGAPYIKIGPLFTDYSSIIRLNEMIRIIQRMSNHETKDNHLHTQACTHSL